MRNISTEVIEMGDIEENIGEFGKWKELLGKDLEFTFSNPKAIFCKSGNRQKTILLEKGTILYILDVSEETQKCVFEILDHPQQKVFKEYLKGKKYVVGTCISHGPVVYRDSEGEIVYVGYAKTQNFMASWFKQ